jgi:hypothetical protein
MVVAPRKSLENVLVCLPIIDGAIRMIEVLVAFIHKCLGTPARFGIS